MTLPLISIIIPTKNSEIYIANCLSSILSQTVQNYEIIILDSKSTDQTLSVAQSFNDERIKIYVETDYGIYDGMNKGLKVANGKWLYFLGSDDELFDTYVLERISGVLINSTNKIVYGNVIINGDAGWAKDGEIYDGKFDLKKILKKNICHQAIFYRDSVFNNMSYNIKYKICADYDLNLRLFSKYVFEFQDIIIAKFKGGGKSAIAQDLHFNHATVVIQYFYKSLYKNDFFFLINPIRSRAVSTSKHWEKIYLNAVYFKHRLFSYVKQN